MTPEQREQFNAVIAKVEELQGVIRNSLPMRASGAGHVFNELLAVGEDLKKLNAAIEDAVEA